MDKALKKKQIPNIEEILITPALATSWLEETKFDNRNISDRNVDRITRDIKAGKWVFDGNAIKFDKEGNLIDGQHRLWAIIRAQCNVLSLVVRGLENKAVDVIDTGKSRSNADVLHFNGYVNPCVLGNVCRISVGYRTSDKNLYAWASGASRTHLSTQEIVKEAKANKSLVDAVQICQSQKFTKKFMGVGTAAFCYHIFAKIDKLQTDEFFYLLEKGSNLPEGSPILALRTCLTLRDHLTSKLTKGGNYRCAYLIALIIKSWNAFREERTVKRITWVMDREEYPLPV